MVKMLQAGLPKNPWLISQQSQQITFFSKALRQSLRHAQPPLKWIPWGLSTWIKVRQL